MPGAIYAEGLVKTFGDVRALDGVDLDVPEGTVLGLLGPNGAGKTTAVRCLTTLLRPDSGTAVVAGIDVLKHPDAVRRSIGLSGQFAAVDEYLTGRENLQMVGQLYQMRRGAAKARAAELLEQFDLADAADRPAKTYSGGMRRRLDLAAALVVSPPVMFMDEPTTGLDPRNRQQLWEVIKRAGLRRDDAAADHPVPGGGRPSRARHRGGRPRPCHRPRHLRPAQGPHRRRARRGRRARARAHRDRRPRCCAGFGKGEVTVEEHTRKLTVPVTGGAKLLAEVIRELDARGIEIDDIGLRRPTLDDVFLSLTGHVAEAKDEGGDETARRASDEGSHEHRARPSRRPPQ